ncbi:apiosidase-like domain-containing protein [Stieleria mannarensis]|uniref:apiosidase-like domain-containing protein n=1 Tax=Stieleria mannarensis TaxID=2755585 RepID=UPI00160201AD|nr:DUF4038 domain-containing protein [Rhodopirellula sp. JC639]
MLKRTVGLLVLIGILSAPIIARADEEGRTASPHAPQWQPIEIEFTAKQRYRNAYVQCQGWVDFEHDDGTKIRRPMFWDGGQTFRVRFASTKPQGVWKWTSASQPNDAGLHGLSGRLQASANSEPDTIFDHHGFWQIRSGERNLVHADGTSRLMCADTPWALPWRATVEQTIKYAEDRKSKGFNAALLMTVMPDSKTTGPRSRTKDGGFDVGFEDLPEGGLRQLNVDYFRYFDKLIEVLVGRGIAPVYQPVFHGYGWKGGGTAGNRVSANDYARYCRYLVARYGARPAIWLVGGDGPATDPNVLDQLDRAGEEIERWDAYGQPTGIHYSPHALNRTHQDKRWLDFQWCQTGHNEEHVPERVADMWRNLPVKAVANGEPTYENIGRMGKASGWWQGHEAWCNICSGGTMGVVYGAASLWNWRLRGDEPGHADWCTAPGAGWEDALQFEGAKYPGIAAKILNQYPIAGMEPNWTCTYGRRGLLIPDKLFVLYLPDGGSTAIISTEVPRSYRVYDPQTGEQVGEGRLPETGRASINSGMEGQPCVVVFHL